MERPIALLGDVSRGGRWITAWTTLPGNDASAWQAFPLDGGPPVQTGGFVWNWSPTGNLVSISGEPIAEGRSYIVPLSPDEAFARMSAGSIRSEQDVAQLSGARRLDALTTPGPSPDVYAFYRSTTQRNLYRIPVP